MNRLQFRVFLSFSLLLIGTLAMIGVIFLAFLSSRPVPLDSLNNDLIATSLQTDFRDYVQAQRDTNSRGLLGARLDEESLAAFLDTYSTETDYRLILVRNNQEVLYDSLGELTEIDLGEKNALPLRTSSRDDNDNAALFYGGDFTLPTGGTWVYVGRGLIGEGGIGGGRVGQNSERVAALPPLDYVVATPRPRQSFRAVLNTFGDTFFLPLIQAGAIAILIASILSVWLSRSVARPLQAVADAANKVAQGDLEQRVPVYGPTEARIVAQAFNEMTEQVKNNQQAQHDFLANVTHDLRTPLTSIQGFSQAIMDGVASDPQTSQQAARVIYEESGRLSRLVSDLLDLAKIQAGRLQMMRHAVEFDQVLDRVGESLQIKAQQKGVRLHVDIADLVRIAGDGDRLAQVFTNLVDNAIKHTDSGGQVWLKASLQKEGGVLVQVQDTGEGIPPDDLSRIFERFYQVDKSRNRDVQHHGAGLGLAITKEIILAHGGKIWAESEIGVGSRFNVWLPTMRSDQTTIIQRRPRR